MGKGLQKEKTTYKSSRVRNMVDLDSGEEVHFMQLTKVRGYKAPRFCKLLSPFDWLLAVRGEAAHGVLKYVAVTLPPNHAWLKISGSAVVGVGVLPSLMQVHRGIKALEKLGVLKKRRRGEWWVNQRCLMNGSKVHPDNPANKEIKL